MSRLSCGALRWRDLAAAIIAYGLRGGLKDSTADMRSALARSLGVDPECVWLFGTGRSALFTVVKALGLPVGAEALLPGYTCVVVPNVFRHLGLRVRYVDVAANGFNPGIDDWIAAISPETRVAVVPHNFGFTSEGIPELRARFPRVVFIEDVAHAWGSRLADGRMAGTAGQAGFFSFEYSKCLTTGLGGALVVNEPSLRERVKPIALQARAPGAGYATKVLATLVFHLFAATMPARLVTVVSNLVRSPARRLGVVAKTGADELQGDHMPDYGLCLHGLLACIGLTQLKRAEVIWQLRRTQARRYGDRLRGSRRFHLPIDDAGQAVLLRYPLLLWEPSERAAVAERLRTLDIEPGLWFDDVVHPRGSARYGYTAGDCPRGEALARAIVNLPLGQHAELNEAQWAGLQSLAAPAELGQ